MIHRPTANGWRTRDSCRSFSIWFRLETSTKPRHLKPPGIEGPWQPTEQPRSWIFVFDIDRESTESPSPLKILYRVAVDAATLIEYAFKIAPRKAIRHGAIDVFRQNLINQRVLKNWKTPAKPKRGKPKRGKPKRGPAGEGKIIVP
jgi:hypothetical protein